MKEEKKKKKIRPKVMRRYVDRFAFFATDDQLKRFVGACMARGIQYAAHIADSEIIYRELEANHNA